MYGVCIKQGTEGKERDSGGIFICGAIAQGSGDGSKGETPLRVWSP